MGSQEICVLVIDSEPKSCRKTVGLLKSSQYVSQVVTAVNTDEALLKLVQINPDLILLEYPVVGMAGNEIISFVKMRFSETTLVFMAKTKDHAAEAIRHEVFNYILKPVTEASLEKLFGKVLVAKQSSSQSRIDQILITTPEEIKLRFQTVRGYVFADPEEIVYCQADGYYTEFFLTGDRKVLSMLMLSKVQKMLMSFNFVRISRSNLVNQKYIRKIYRESNTITLLADGKEYTVKGSKIPIRNLIKSENE